MEPCCSAVGAVFERLLIGWWTLDTPQFQGLAGVNQGPRPTFPAFELLLQGLNLHPPRDSFSSFFYQPLVFVDSDADKQRHSTDMMSFFEVPHT